MGFLRSFVVFTAAASIASAVGSPVPDDKITDLTWHIKTPSGKTYEVNGTVQEAVAQVKDLDPDYAKHFDGTVAGLKERDTSDDVGSLSKREVACGGYGDAGIVDISDGIAYLRGVTGSVYSPAGPSSCHRVSCSYGAAITWCNDNTHEFTLSSFNTIADAAQNIVNNCFKNGALLGSGVDDHADHWRGIVGTADC